MFPATQLTRAKWGELCKKQAAEMPDREVPATSWAVWAWQAYRDGRLVENTQHKEG